MKYTITTTGCTHTVHDAQGALVARATFTIPRRPEDCATVMRERAAWFRRWGAQGGVA